jgi:predicted nucleic acid-binding protein
MKKGSSDVLLLDVNVLLAIAWPNHQFHTTAIAAVSPQNRWATSALTELEFIRLSQTVLNVV